MNRTCMLKKMVQKENEPFDVLIIGGGATGLGTGLDAASRGYKTLLLEQNDFAKGTSSRSTKLVHGGVRYLAQGDVSLVLEALRERGILLTNAPHLVTHQSFIIPNFKWWDGPLYTIGMKLYDTMAGKLGLGPSVHISKEEVLNLIPNLRDDELLGGVKYYDAQFDDARLAVNLAQSIADHNGVVVNYMQVVDFIKDKAGMVKGVRAVDMLTGRDYSIWAKGIVNATGVFADTILQLDQPTAPKRIKPSQGVHLILDSSFLDGEDAIMIPKTADGRVLFAVPWNRRVVVGTTDTEVDTISLEPRALNEEIEFILSTASKYLVKKPTRRDVLSVFAGLRPLAVSQMEGVSTKDISRRHKVLVSLSGLVSVLGGKWTTYRKMAEDAVDAVMLMAGLEEQPCITKTLRIHGYKTKRDSADPLAVYGTDGLRIRRMISNRSFWGKPLCDGFSHCVAEVLWICRNEMVCTLEDIMARRFRALLLDAKGSVVLAQKVAPIMAEELGYGRNWIHEQLDQYEELVRGYLV